MGGHDRRSNTFIRHSSYISPRISGRVSSDARRQTLNLPFPILPASSKAAAPPRPDVSVDDKYIFEHYERPNGLVVGYLLWVQGIPGSNPGWAPLFSHFPGAR